MTICRGNLKEVLYFIEVGGVFFFRFYFVLRGRGTIVVKEHIPLHSLQVLTMWSTDQIWPPTDNNPVSNKLKAKLKELIVTSSWAPGHRFV